MQALVLEGRVVQVETEAFPVAEPLRWIACRDDVQPGWSCDGQAFAAPTVVAEPVHMVVTMRQGRLALLQAGLLDSAEAVIAAMAGAEGTAARIEWEYATELKRDHPLVVSLGAALGQTPEQIDALFDLARTL
jgi:hypothetical protein